MLYSVQSIYLEIVFSLCNGQISKEEITKATVRALPATAYLSRYRAIVTRPQREPGGPLLVYPLIAQEGNTTPTAELKIAVLFNRPLCHFIQKSTFGTLFPWPCFGIVGLLLQECQLLDAVPPALQVHCRSIVLEPMAAVFLAPGTGTASGGMARSGGQHQHACGMDVHKYGKSLHIRFYPKLKRGLLFDFLFFFSGVKNKSPS